MANDVRASFHAAIGHWFMFFREIYICILKGWAAFEWLVPITFFSVWFQRRRGFSRWHIWRYKTKICNIYVSSQLFGMGIFSVILRKMELQGDWTLMRIQHRVGPDKDGAVPSPPPPLTHSRSEEKILEFWTRSPVVLLLCWEKPFILFTGLN